MESFRNLTKQNEAQLIGVLIKYQKVFDNKPECLKTYTYDLKLKEDITVKPKQCPIAQTMKHGIRKELERWKEWIVIERSESQHYNPLHAVRKADGSVRPVLDLRELNKHGILPKIQVESIDSMLHSYPGS